MSQDNITPSLDNLIRHYDAYGLDRKKDFRGNAVEKHYKTYNQARSNTLIASP